MNEQIKKLTLSHGWMNDSWRGLLTWNEWITMSERMNKLLLEHMKCWITSSIFVFSETSWALKATVFSYHVYICPLLLSSPPSHQPSFLSFPCDSLFIHLTAPPFHFLSSASPPFPSYSSIFLSSPSSSLPPLLSPHLTLSFLIAHSILPLSPRLLPHLPSFLLSSLLFTFHSSSSVLPLLLTQYLFPLLLPPCLSLPLGVIRSVGVDSVSVSLCVCSVSMASLGLLLLSTALIHTAQVGRHTPTTHTDRERLHVCLHVCCVFVLLSSCCCVVTVTWEWCRMMVLLFTCLLLRRLSVCVWC